MIFHSVVGKLWITIIILVSTIFLFLSIALIEYFDHYYYVEQSNSLTQLGDKVSNIVNEYPDKESAFTTIDEVVKTVNFNMVITQQNAVGEFQAVEGLFSTEQLQNLYAEKLNVVRFNDQSYSDFITFNSSNDILALAVPYSFEGETGVIILYQTLEGLYKTTSDIKKIILLFAGIGILITTFFSFFLSTRITAPVRSIQKAANLMAQGDFQARVNIKSTDEIGDLADSFNQMASQLNDTVQALFNEKEKLANILKYMADGVITFNTAGEIMIANPIAEGLLYSWKDQSFTLPEEMKGTLKILLKERKKIEQDIQIKGRIFAVKMTPLYSVYEVIGAVAILRDVTNDRKLNKLRKDFLANVSHELRTPISMLQGYSEAIIDDVAETPDEKKELAKIIYDESLRMGRLVNELLDIAKMESGTIQLQYCKTDVNKIVSKMIKKFSNLATEQSITLVSDFGKYLGEANLDPDRIEQVLTNLIDNAIRHTPKGGEIILRAKRSNPNTILLEVQDTGIGISEEDLPFVFERFYKADKARTRTHAGTGLGLSIVKNIVHAHNGTISVSSNLGKGTVFSILLPVNNFEKTIKSTDR